MSEAARVDGAILAGTAPYAAADAARDRGHAGVRLIVSVKVFDEIYLLTGGGWHRTEVVSYTSSGASSRKGRPGTAR
jgi:hypothetical protein